MKAHNSDLLIPETNIQTFASKMSTILQLETLLISTWVQEEGQDVRSVSSVIVQSAESKPGATSRKE